MTVKRDDFFLSFRRLDWHGHQILVWPIAALPNDLSADQKGVFSVRSDAETGFNSKNPVTSKTPNRLTP